MAKTGQTGLTARMVQTVTPQQQPLQKQTPGLLSLLPIKTEQRQQPSKMEQAERLPLGAITHRGVKRVNQRNTAPQSWLQ